MGGPYCCGLIPHLELAHHPQLIGQPLVVGYWGSGGHVLACSEEAAEAGVRPGITMRNAELDLDPELMDRLELLGLRTLGAVAAIGPRRLESQLGPPGRHAVLLARGEEPDRLVAWQPPRCMSAERRLEPPVEDREALL